MPSASEVSNVAKLIGRVCTPTEDIVFSETEKGVPFCKYQIAVNRKLYLADSEGEDDHSDYPVVYSYGKQAEDDSASLKQGALVYIDGFVRTVGAESNVVCASCEKEFPFKTRKMSLSPYSVEYLRDYNETLESTHKKDVTPEASIEDNDAELEG